MGGCRGQLTRAPTSLRPTLRVLSLDDNFLTDLEPLSAFHVHQLSAAYNPGLACSPDRELGALAAMLERGGLPALRSLYLSTMQADEDETPEQAGDKVALKAACEARAISCHCAVLPA